MNRLCAIGLLLLLVARSVASEVPLQTNAVVQAVAPRSQSGRAFDARLAALHEKWMGTPWAFSGTTQTPQQGSIACGYFVTTTLEQAGLKLDRVRLAQAASERMILALIKPDDVTRYRDASLRTFLDGVRREGEGYYIVGLDQHTGFLNVSTKGEVAFIHSAPGRGVTSEKPADAPELANSRYRVTGKISVELAIEESATVSPNQPAAQSP